jgi:hypothetical protein
VTKKRKMEDNNLMDCSNDYKISRKRKCPEGHRIKRDDECDINIDDILGDNTNNMIKSFFIPFAQSNQRFQSSIYFKQNSQKEYRKRKQEFDKNEIRKLMKYNKILRKEAQKHSINIDIYGKHFNPNIFTCGKYT